MYMDRQYTNNTERCKKDKDYHKLSKPHNTYMDHKKQEVLSHMKSLHSYT